MKTKEELINFLLETEIPDDLDSKKESEIVSEVFKYSWDLTPKNLYRCRSCNPNNFKTLEEDKFLLTNPTLDLSDFDNSIITKNDFEFQWQK